MTLGQGSFRKNFCPFPDYPEPSPVTAHSEANVWSQPETTESVAQSQTTAFDDDVCTLGVGGRADLSSCAREHHR